MRNHTQAVFDRLQKGPATIQQLKALGGTHVAARIYDLRAQGHVVTCREGVYTLEQQAQANDRRVKALEAEVESLKAQNKALKVTVQALRTPPPAKRRGREERWRG